MAGFPALGSPGSRSEGNPDGSSDTLTFGSNAFPAPNAMVFDAAGNLYVSDSFQGAIYRVASATTCAPCTVSAVALDGNGRPAIRAGEFLGMRGDGTPRGLLFPASLATADGFVYVTNLALPLTPATGDEPEESVTRWTVSRFRLPK